MCAAYQTGFKWTFTGFSSTILIVFEGFFGFSITRQIDKNMIFNSNNFEGLKDQSNRNPLVQKSNMYLECLSEVRFRQALPFFGTQATCVAAVRFSFKQWNDMADMASQIYIYHTNIVHARGHNKQANKQTNKQTSIVNILESAMVHNHVILALGNHHISDAYISFQWYQFLFVILVDYFLKCIHNSDAHWSCCCCRCYCCVLWSMVRRVNNR